MKIVLSIIVVLVGLGFFAFTSSNATPNMTNISNNFYDLAFTDIDGIPMRMADFEGKYVLCVNVASKCGYTKQYKPLQELHEKYQDRLVIVGFPCNQFLNQEPGSEEEIAEFCEKNYGVSFLMTEKIDVKGKEQHPIYSWLTSKSLNGVADAKVSWNFNKFLISPNGKWLAHFESKVDPLSDEIIQLLQ